MSIRGRKSHTRALSLVEIVLVSGITALIAGISMIAFASFSRNEALAASAAALASGLRDARAQTLASVGGSQYGIYVTADSYIFFKGASYVANDVNNKTFYFGSYVKASSTPSVFVFQRITGNAVASGTIDVYLATDSSKKKLVEVAATGLVDIHDVP